MVLSPKNSAPKPPETVAASRKLRNAFSISAAPQSKLSDSALVQCEANTAQKRVVKVYELHV
jgi:hypothetical protein